MTMHAFTFQARYRRVTAIQFTGADSVPVLQAFLSPLSPYFTPAHDGYDNRFELQVPVFDAIGMVQYPTLGRRYKMALVPMGSWVVKGEDGEISVMTNAEFVDRFEEVPVRVESLVRELGRTFSNPVAGDDIDPTGVVFVDSERQAAEAQVEAEDAAHAEAEYAEHAEQGRDPIVPGVDAHDEQQVNFHAAAAEATHPDDDIKF